MINLIMAFIIDIKMQTNDRRSGGSGIQGRLWGHVRSRSDATGEDQYNLPYYSSSLIVRTSMQLSIQHFVMIYVFLI